MKLLARYLPLALALAVLCGCDLLKGGETTPETVVGRQLNLLQISLEQFVKSDKPTTVAVVCVVDSYAMRTAEVEEEAQLEAQARERLARQEVQACLVVNTLIDVVQPDEQAAAQARAEVVANNSAALSAATADQIGRALGVEFLISMLIDQEGAQVNIVAQRVADGKLVFQETLLDWPVLVGEAGEAG